MLLGSEGGGTHATWEKGAGLPGPRRPHYPLTLPCPRRGAAAGPQAGQGRGGLLTCLKVSFTPSSSSHGEISM